MTHPLDTQEAPAGNVIEALRRVMRDLPGISKSKDPNGGVAYAFRGIEAITKEAQGLCVQHGVIFTPRVVGVPEVVDITVNNKPWTDTRMLVEYTVYGPGGADDFIVVGPIFAIGRDNSDKGANKCMTQAFKYALLQTFMIADEKDDGDKQSQEADYSASRAENGNPYRRSTLRADITAADVAKMGTAELTERLTAADLSPNGSAAERKGRLTEYVDRSSVARKNAPGETILIPGQESVTVPATEIVVGDSGPMAAGACAICTEPVLLGDAGDPDRGGVETEDGRLIHAGCVA